jgi:hypothetical protein
VDKAALGQVFSEYFGFPCQSPFHRLLHNHHRSSGAGTIDQQWPTYQVDSVSPHPEKLKKKPKKILETEKVSVAVTPGPIFGRYSVRISVVSPDIMIEVSRVSPQSVQEHFETLLRLGHDRFLSNPFQFTIDVSSHHSTLCSLDARVIKGEGTVVPVLN